jgi:proteasome accessory factor C
MSVTDRLARLIFIVPYVAHQGGVSVKELAKILDVTPKQIKADIELLLMVGHPPLTPDHLIDISIEDEQVYVDLDQNLSRPLRLTRDETQALILATKLVGDLGGLGERLHLIVEKLLHHLTPEEADTLRSMGRHIILSSGFSEALTPTPLLRRAIQEHQEIELDYYSVSSDQHKAYQLQPLALVNHSGIAYLVALDVKAQCQEKLFRCDRMSKLCVSESHFDPPDTLDLERFRVPSLFSGDRTQGAEVDFSPDVAARVREQFPANHIRILDDRSIRVELTTSSLAWLARWILPFQLHAEVVSPPQQRQALYKRCHEAALTYESPPQPVAISHRENSP